MVIIDFIRGANCGWTAAVTLPLSAWTMTVRVRNPLDPTAPAPDNFTIPTPVDLGENDDDPTRHDYVFTVTALPAVTTTWPASTDGNPIEYEATMLFHDAAGNVAFSESVTLLELPS